MILLQPETMVYFLWSPGNQPHVYPLCEGNRESTRQAPDPATRKRLSSDDMQQGSRFWHQVSTITRKVVE